MMLFGNKLSQAHLTLGEKSNGLLTFFTAQPLGPLSIMVVIILTLLILIVVVKHSANHHAQNAIILFTATLLITLIAPFTLNAHYIFGVVTLLFILIGTLNPNIAIPLSLGLSVLWLQPSLIKSYFIEAPRTVGETLACAQKICSTIQEPVTVSIQSGYQPYHDGQDWQYLFKRAGCDVLDINNPAQKSNKMLVVVDNSSYEQGKTQYHELTLFGPSIDTQTISCQPNLSIHVLKKI